MLKKQQLSVLISLTIVILLSSNLTGFSFSTLVSSNIESAFVKNKSFNHSNFQELMPGVFVKHLWSNESEIYNITESRDIDDYPFNETSPFLNPFFLVVFDTEGNLYYIVVEEELNWLVSWNATRFTVVILVDPDPDLISLLSTTDPDTLNINIDSYRGNGTIYSTDFYILDWSYSYSINENYTWYDSSYQEIDPNDIIPNLAPEFEWANQYNESVQYSDEGQYSVFGFSVYQHTLLNITEDFLTTFQVKHFFEGLSIFNDTNENGIMDVSYENFYDYGYHEIAWLFNNSIYIGAEESELVYQVWITQVTLDEISIPQIVNNQIDWSIKMTDIYTELWTTDSVIWTSDPVNDLEPSYDNNDGRLYEGEFQEIIISIIEFDFSFSIENDTTRMKSNRLIGDFTDKNTGTVLSTLTNLSLAVNYWSTYSFDETNYELALIDKESNESLSYDGILYNSSGWGDEIEFSISNEAISDKITPVAIEFDEYYNWEKDNNNYAVNTQLIPSFTFSGDFYHQAGLSDEYGFEDVFVTNTYYYSSCYSQWDGYGVIHGATFSSSPSGLNPPPNVIIKVFPWLLFGGILVTLVITLVNLGIISIRIVRFRTTKKP
ncbi:MAG: hypothetical protein ACFE9L_20095 [Candidatus Hodarchaeota archaeon]